MVFACACSKSEALVSPRPPLRSWASPAQTAATRRTRRRTSPLASERPGESLYRAVQPRCPGFPAPLSSPGVVGVVWCAPPPCPCSGQQAAEFVAAGVYNKRRHALVRTGYRITGWVGHKRRHRLFAYAWCLYARDRSTDTCPLSSSCHVCSLSRWLRATCSTHSLPYTHSMRATQTPTSGDSALAIPALRQTTTAVWGGGLCCIPDNLR